MPKAVHDRLYFLRNQKSLGVKSGSLGTLEKIAGGVLQVKLDSGQRVAVDSRFYQDLEHGYAATVDKARGVTVDRSYVALSRHRRDARPKELAHDDLDREMADIDAKRQQGAQRWREQRAGMGMSQRPEALSQPSPAMWHGPAKVLDL
ncbi:MAG: hypothetical protein WA825_12050 [Steroidobacteraceae bacterium]